MRFHVNVLRRLAGGLGAVAFLAAGLMGAGAAHADDVVIRLDASPAEVLVYPYREGSQPQPKSSFTLKAVNPGPVITPDATYTFDFSELAGVVDLSFEDELDGTNPYGYHCTISGTTGTCSGHSPHLRTWDNIIGGVIMTPAKGSKEGDTGTVKITAKADGVTFTSTTAKVTIGGPALATFGLSPNGDEITRTKPGDVYKAPLAFANVGTQAAEKVLLEMEITAGLDYATKYSNCEYGTRTLTEGRPAGTVETEALCEFDQAVATQTTADLDEPVQLVVNEHALADQFHYRFFEDTPAARAAASGSVKFTRGTERALSLTLKPTDPPDNYVGGFDLVNFQTSGTSADYVAKGDKATGAVGDIVTATVGFTNQGPAWVGNVRDDGGVAAITWFTVPAGAEVVQSPDVCTGMSIPGQSWDPDRTGSPLYECPTGVVANVGQTFSYTFRLRIVKAVKHAEGSVFISGKGGIDKRSTAPAFDKSPANNAATFVLSSRPGEGSGGSSSGSSSGGSAGSPGGSGSSGGSGGPGSNSGVSGSGSGSSTGGNSASGEGSHGVLAFTGAAGLGIIGGASLLALGVGGGLWITVWRRKKAQA